MARLMSLDVHVMSQTPDGDFLFLTIDVDVSGGGCDYWSQTPDGDFLFLTANCPTQRGLMAFLLKNLFCKGMNFPR